MGDPTAWQNPYTSTAMLHGITFGGELRSYTHTLVGSDTLWTTGRVGAFADR